MTRSLDQKPPRRWFLQTAVAGSGALVLGVTVGPMVARVRRHQKIRATEASTGIFRPSAWLAIYPDDRIVLTLDRVEMGQGTTTSHAMLIAEELEVDPAWLEVEHAVADRRYDHPEFRLQMTGGSSSVRTSWERLRYAGAVAREMLRAGAADAWGVPLAECTPRDGAVHHDASGRSRSYGSLTRRAATQPIAAPALKPPLAHVIIGTPVNRVDAPPKVDGSGVFGIDVTLPGLLYAVVVRSPEIGARVVSFDARTATRRPGVVAVVQISTGVAVVAERSWQARSAAAEVNVRWESGRRDIDTPSMTEQLRRLAALPGRPVRNDGNAEAVLNEAAGNYLEAVYDLPHLAHAPMEPQNCTASVKDDRCEVWAPTQAPGLAREVVSSTLGLPRDRVVVHTTWLGGGFGRRLAADYVLEAVEVARQVSRPVKVVWSREDDMRHSMYRPQTRHLLRAVLAADGQPRAWHHRVAAPSLLAGIIPSWMPAMTPDAVPASVNRQLEGVAERAFEGDWVADPTSTEGASDTPYDIENLRVELARHEAGVPIGFWRSVGHSHTAFAVESFIDELAVASGQDPFLYRHQLLRRAPRHRKVLVAAATAAGWGRPLSSGRFRGIAQHHSFESYVAQVAEVSVTDGNLRVHRVVCAVDCGRVINPDIVKAQMESSVVFGLSAALKQRISYRAGQVEQSNFHDFEMLRFDEMPQVDVVILPSSDDPTGVGEPGVPPVAPAVANAVTAATGRRIRTLPIERVLEGQT